MTQLSRRAAIALAVLPPVYASHPHWVKFFVDGGNVMSKSRGRRATVRGVYWSMRCEDGSAEPVTIRQRDITQFSTNNDAEWLALREALTYAVAHHADVPIIIYSDSQLVVKQFNNQWRTKIARHFRLHQECKNLTAQLKFVILQWVPREVSVAKLGH